MAYDERSQAMTIHYQIEFTVCPHCFVQVRRGIRRFGPAQIRCGNCGETFNARLDEWKKLSLEAKLLKGLSEVVWPSWLGLSGCNGVFLGLLTQLVLCSCAAMPLALMVTGLPSDYAPLMLIAFLTYPVIHVVRLVGIINESNRYTLKGTVPTWGKPKKKAK
jgi:hypothetical protein